MRERLGDTIGGRYRIEGLIGAGGIGAVYRARQLSLERPVAVKMLHPSLAVMDDARRRFAEEARALGTLNHPHIATVHDFGETEDGEQFLVLEFVGGEALSQLAEREPLPFAVLRQIFDQILRALTHAHERDIVHRDVKPANILIDADGDGNPRAKLVDFGIALAGSDTTALQENLIEGTPHFMAPEQAEGRQHVTPAADVYALALTLWWSLTGTLPFDGPTPRAILDAQLHAALPPFEPLRGVRAPEGIEELLREALAKDPAQRIPDARLFRARLEAVAGGGWVSSIDPPPSLEWTSPTSNAPLDRPRPKVARTLREVPESAVARSIIQAPGALNRPAAARPARTLRESATLVESAPSESAAPAPVLDVDAHPNQPMFRSDAPLVGRSEERTRLLEFAVAASSGNHGMLLTLEGEAGLGKSKLAHWFRTTTASRFGFRCARGVFHQDAERGLRGIRESFESLLGTRGMDGQRLRTHLQSTLTRIGLTEERDTHTLLQFLRPGSELVGAGTSSGVIDVLNDTMLRTIEAFGKEEPVLLLLEDVHWAGPEAASWLRFCLNEFRHRELRVLILLTVQTEDVRSPLIESLLTDIGRFDPSVAHRFKLAKLGIEQARQLVGSMLNAAPELTEALVQRADGNPMHAVQLARYLRDEHLLEWSARGWRAKRDVDVTRLLPPSLADTVALRIATLEEQPQAGPRVRALLNRAAVLGMSFRVGVLERMLEIEGNHELLATLDEDLDRILDADLLRLVEKRFADLISFPSSLIRDVILERLRGRRSGRRMHLLAAQAKRDVTPDEVEKLAIELMEHHAAARDPAGELAWCRRAADIAERSHRPHEALRLLERALHLHERHPSLVEDAPQERRRLLLRMAGLATGFGQHERAMESYGRVIHDPDTPLDERLSARLGEAELLWMRGDFDRALAQTNEVRSEAETNARPELTLRAWLDLARLHWHRGDLEATESALAFAQAMLTDPDHAQWAEYTWLQADLDRSRGHLEDAYRRFEEARALFGRHDNQRGIAKCHAKLAVVARMSGDLETATRHYRDALDLYAALGARRGVAHQLNGLGDIARYRGDLDLATEHYRRAVDIFQSIGVPFDAAIALTNLGIVAREGGRRALSEDAFRRALLVSERVGFKYLVLGVQLNLALLLAMQDNLEEAESLASAALTLADAVSLVDPDFAEPMDRLATVLEDPSLRKGLRARAERMWTELGGRPKADARIPG